MPLKDGILGHQRPVRKRTVVPTFNLKVLNGNARHTRTSSPQRHPKLTERSMSPVPANMNKSSLKAKDYPSSMGSSTSSPLTSPMASPRIDALKTAASLEVNVSNKVFLAQQTDGATDTDESESEDSVIGTTTRRHALLEISSAPTSFTSVELRLYRKTTSVRPDGYRPVIPYGPMFLLPDCNTAHECFRRICGKIQADCSFMVFHLPEDMEGVIGGVRLNRGSRDAEMTFQSLLEVFRKATKFPGEPQYRSVEVEVGLDMHTDD